MALDIVFMPSYDRDSVIAEIRRAIASGSIRFELPSNQMDEVKVLLPDPFGPATTDNADGWRTTVAESA